MHVINKNNKKECHKSAIAVLQLFNDIVGAGTVTLPEHLSSPAVFSGIRVALSLVLCLMFCRSLFVLLCFFFWFFFDLRILIHL